MGLGADYVHLLVPAMLIVLSSFVDYQPAFSLDYRLVFWLFSDGTSQLPGALDFRQREASLLEKMTLTLVPKAGFHSRKKPLQPGNPARPR